MEAINLPAQVDTPLIVLDKVTGHFEFTGKSLPEDVSAFYGPVLAWLDEYKNDPNDSSEFIFKLDYFNTSSSKIYYKILEKINEIHKTGKEVTVLWYYPDDDDDMLEVGEDYSEVDYPFELIAYTPE